MSLIININSLSYLYDYLDLGVHDFIVGTNGTTVSKEVYDMSNAEFVQEVANISNKKVNEELTQEGKSVYGHVAGSKKHSEAYRIASDYQEFVDEFLKIRNKYKDKFTLENISKEYFDYYLNILELERR